MQVFVLDQNRKPLDPCSPARARILLAKGRAAVFRRLPFTIILKDRTVEESTVHEHRLKIDPGSEVTGVAVVQEETGQVIAAAEIEHRGGAVKAALDSRRAIRRNRRNRKTRYRQPRFQNRVRKPGWLPPSLESRIANVLTWVDRIRKFCPIAAISQELAKFDLQKEEDPEIAGIEYQQGTLAGYEVREYGVPIATEQKTTNLVPTPANSAVRLLKTRLRRLDSRKPIRERLSRIKIPRDPVIAA